MYMIPEYRQESIFRDFFMELMTISQSRLIWMSCLSGWNPFLDDAIETADVDVAALWHRFGRWDRCGYDIRCVLPWKVQTEWGRRAGTLHSKVPCRQAGTWGERGGCRRGIYYKYIYVDWPRLKITWSWQCIMACVWKINTETAKTLNAACPISDGQAEFGVFFDGGQKHA